MSTLGDLWLPPAGLEARMRELRKLRGGRQLHEAMRAAEAELQDEGADAAHVASRVLATATVVAENQDTSARPLADIVSGVYDQAMAEASGERQVLIPSGLDVIDADSRFGGLSSEGVTLILGGSGMGKTSLLNRLALGVANGGRGVYLHGTETSTARRTRDLLFSLARVDQRAFADAGRQPYAVEQDQRALYDGAAYLHELPIRITGGELDVDGFCARVKAYHRRGLCDVAIADYLQDFPHTREAGRIGDMTSQAAYSSRRIKETATELGIPIIVGAQVSGEKSQPSKTTGKKWEPRPHMWDCQWTSGAHQDAEEVYAIFREDYFKDRYPDWAMQGEPGTMELIARKRRSGPLGTWVLDFDGPTKWVGESLRAKAHNRGEEA